MSSTRGKAFSGKKKKEQLQLKKQIKNQKIRDETISEASVQNDTYCVSKKSNQRQDKINLSSNWDVVGANVISPRNNPEYQNQIVSLDNEWRHVTFEHIFGLDSTSLTIPIRPEWSYNYSRDELDESEQKYFKNWIAEIYEKVPNRNQLSFFEHNIEVWRQLWRVCEISNILVVVADIRNPIVHLPPSFCYYVTQKLKKPMIIALTKSDLVSCKLRNEWANYLKDNFCNARIHFLSTFDSSEDIETKNQKRYIHASGVVELLKDIKSFSIYPALDNQWEKLISGTESRIEGKYQSSLISIDGPKDGDLFTMGFIGQPNVGKSSLINSIFGRKVVSASRTPGHTKHFQTLHLSAGIRVCDSPGLVFPSIIDKNLQILCGIYNIAQVKDPYGPILYLSRRIDMFKILNIAHSVDPDQPDSVFYLCEEYAKLRGFITSKAGRPDTYRAANFILRRVIDGKIVLSWTPPGFEEELPLVAENIYSGYSDSENKSDDENDEDFDDENNEEKYIEDFNIKCRFSVLKDIIE